MEPEVFLLVDQGKVNEKVGVVISALRAIGQTVLDTGEVRVTGAVPKALTPSALFRYLTLHQTGEGLTEDEKLLREEVMLQKSGRVVSRWVIGPKVTIDEATWRAKILNSEFAGKLLCIATRVGEDRATLACIEGELPKCGLLGDGAKLRTLDEAIREE